jgi:HlyD family secretion protein
VAKRVPGQFWLMWAAGGLITLAAVAGAGYYAMQNFNPTQAAAGEQGEQSEPPPPVHVEVVLPEKGGMDHTTTQPGSVHAFDSAQLVAEVTGYLKKQKVDIGDRVKKGEVLAVIDVPDLEANLKRQSADVDRAQGKIKQMQARVKAAEADKKETEAEVMLAQATVKATDAYFHWRTIQYRRFVELLAEKSIDARLVDEEEDRREAALQAKNEALASVARAEAKVVAMTAKIESANADLIEARAELEVSKAQEKAAQVQVDFATIKSPYDGAISFRSKHEGDFVRSAGGGSTEPLLVVQRTDKFRVVVLVPDKDVPFVDVGDPAIVEIDNLPGQRFTTQLVPGKQGPQPITVARLAESEDPQTRLMRVEVDMYQRPPTEKQIKPGMFGNVTIILDQTNLLTVPSTAVFNKSANGKAEVLVVKDGRIQHRVVQFAGSNGSRTAIRAGLTADDLVVVHRFPDLRDGETVTYSMAEPESHVNSRGHQ